MMLVDWFQPAREAQALESELDRLSQDYRTLALQEFVTREECEQLRAELASARSAVSHLRGKLIDVRPYVVAYANGSSLQAKGDLRALDATLRATKGEARDA